MRVAIVLALFCCAGETGPRPTAADPEEAVLRTAAAFRDVAVGYAGTTPAEVRAFRNVLASPDGAARFRRLLANATVAGQLYALCGLFFLDAPAFDLELARLRRQGGQVEQQQGCIVSASSLSAILASHPLAPRMSHAASFREWLRRGARAPVLDLAGGGTCYRLRFGSKFPTAWLDDPARAPEAGPRFDDDAR